MDSNPLIVGTYKRYKASTRKLVQWLAQTADNISALHTDTTKSGKKYNSSTRKKVPVDSLVPLAKVIINADPRGDIEISILELARDSVQGRKECALWYEALGKRRHDGGEMAESNRAHRYMLGKLEEIFELLKREVKSRCPKRKKKIDLASDLGDMSNIYHHIVEEETSTSDDFPAVNHATKKGQKTEMLVAPKTQFELEGSVEEEQLFALYCLLRDLQQLRRQTSTTWEQYKSGQISFVTACHTTESAIQIACVFSKELEKEHPNLAEFINVMKLVGEESFVCGARGMTVTADVDPVEVEHSQLLLMPAWAIAHDVDCLGRLLQNDHELTNSSRPATVFTCHPFAKAMLDIVGDLADIAAVHLSRAKFEATKHPIFDALFYNIDHFSKQLLHLISGRTEVTTGFVAAIALYMDVYAALDGDLERGTRECAPILREMSASAYAFSDWYQGLDAYSRFHVAPDKTTFDDAFFLDTASQIIPDQMSMGRRGWIFKAPDLPDSLRHVSESLVEGLKSRVIDNKIGNNIGSFANEERRFMQDMKNANFQSSFIPINILATLPILVGHATWKIMYQVQISGLPSCNTQHSVLAAAHLHSAARAQGSCVEDWPDMDLIIERERKKSMLTRDGHQRVHAAAKQYCFALGMPLTQVLRAERPAMPSRPFRKRNAAQFTGASYLRANDDKRDMTSMGSVLRFQRQYDMRKLHQAVAFFAAEGPGLKDSSITKQWQQTKKLGPHHIMQVLQDIAVEDEKYMYIDYLGIHRRAIEILGRATAYQDVPERFGLSATSAKDKVMAEVVYDIIWDAAALEKQGLAAERSVLYIVGKMMDQILRYDGDVGLKRINELSIGQQLPSQAPMVLYGPTVVALRQPPHMNKVDILHGRILLDMSNFYTRNSAQVEEEIVRSHIGHFPQWLASTPSLENTLSMVKVSVTHALKKARISKRVENVSVKPDGVLHLMLGRTEGYTGADKSAEELDQQARSRKVESLKSGVQLLTHEQAVLAENGLVKAYAGIEPDGRLVLRLCAVST